METPQNNTPRELYRILRILYIALLSGCVMYIAIAYALVQQTQNVYGIDKASLYYFWVTSLCITMAVIPGTYYLYKKQLEKMNSGMNVTEKLIFIKTPFIIRIALLEAACIINATLYLMTAYNYILYAALIVLVIMIIYFPTRSGIANDLQLSPGDSDQL